MKLTTNDEVIAEEVGCDKYARPRVLQVMQTEAGYQPALSPWLISSPEETVEISDKFVVTKLEASMDIDRAYRQQTSRIQLMG
jgi:hypothetical protein